MRKNVFLTNNYFSLWDSVIPDLINLIISHSGIRDSGDQGITD